MAGGGREGVTRIQRSYINSLADPGPRESSYPVVQSLRLVIQDKKNSSSSYTWTVALLRLTIFYRTWLIIKVDIGYELRTTLMEE
ncbi:hypothetical protein ACJ73_04179 [Blastomyces percursus]|uniref:Uncharacterized protein n=1 Tax=Blastomyces percursus TaxID=1658174 RepID=A0A1J9R7I9_9EURO|nr:hypothetical protein ACJ73_04179 [Blastomyces percursus]